MRRNTFLGTLLSGLLILGTAVPSLAMDRAQERKFEWIRVLTLDTLTEKAKTSLEKKYPKEDWSVYDLPSYVHTSDSVEVGYKIAVKEPQVLAVATCACFCTEIGHDTLAYCFLKEGKRSAGFDDHAVSCEICLRQTMLAFLWSELGATPQEIQAGMNKEYGT